MSQISAKAYINKNAIIGKNVQIAPFAIIDENVKIGDNTIIGPNVYITGWTDIGKNNKILIGAAIGGEPQDLSYKGDRSYVQMGDNNIIHEYVTIHRGTAPDSKTVIGNNNMLMAYSHLGHNVILHNNVVIVNAAAIGGYVEIDDSAFISAVTQVHQFCKIGKYVMIALMTKITKDVPPYMLVAGSDVAVVRSLNIVGMRRARISPADREIIKKAYKILYHSNLNTTDAIAAMKNENQLKNNKFVIELINFIKNSKRGISSHKK